MVLCADVWHGIYTSEAKRADAKRGGYGTQRGCSSELYVSLPPGKMLKSIDVSSDDHVRWSRVSSPGFVDSLTRGGVQGELKCPESTRVLSAVEIQLAIAKSRRLALSRRTAVEDHFSMIVVAVAIVAHGYMLRLTLNRGAGGPSPREWFSFVVSLSGVAAIAQEAFTRKGGVAVDAARWALVMSVASAALPCILRQHAFLVYQGGQLPWGYHSPGPDIVAAETVIAVTEVTHHLRVVMEREARHNSWCFLVLVLHFVAWVLPCLDAVFSPFVPGRPFTPFPLFCVLATIVAVFFRRVWYCVHRVYGWM